MSKKPHKNQIVFHSNGGDLFIPEHGAIDRDKVAVAAELLERLGEKRLSSLLRHYDEKEGGRCDPLWIPCG